MSDRSTHVLYAMATLVVLVSLSTAIDAEVGWSRSDGLWFEVAIGMVVAAFLLEPNYSGGAAAATNGFATFFVVAGADWNVHDAWWAILGVASVVSFTTSLISFGLNVPHTRSPRRLRVARAMSLLATRLGSWRSLLLGSLALALATFNEPFGQEWLVAAVVATMCLFLSQVRPHQLIHTLRGAAAQAAQPVVSELYPPFEAVVSTPTDTETRLAVGAQISVSGEGREAYGIVTSEVLYGGLRGWRVFIPQLMSVLPASHVGTEPFGLKVRSPDVTGAAVEFIHDELQRPDACVLGVLTEGTAIRSAVVELRPNQRVELGQVIWTRDSGGRTLWQIADATIARTAWSGDSRRTTHASASQIGRWNDATMSFEGDLRSPSPSDVVFGGALEAPTTAVPPHGTFRVGSLPKSPFPVLIDLARLSRTHGAVLGTTGTGKTHLAFALIDGFVDLGVKVVCVDLTGQYSIRYTAAVHAVDAPGVRDFLKGDDKVAICVPAHGTAIRTANAVARVAYEWASSLPRPNPAEPARCVIVLEEAQNFIPEAFVIDDWNLKATAQDTSLVVMEARKFGIGFLIISQRTAMVTKSALSQCNTVFAFQAVDQTGLDYLEGICGPALARTVPTLPHRTAIVMGNALRSGAPLIVYVDEAPVVVP